MTTLLAAVQRVGGWLRQRSGLCSAIPLILGMSDGLAIFVFEALHGSPFVPSLAEAVGVAVILAIGSAILVRFAFEHLADMRSTAGWMGLLLLSLLVAILLVTLVVAIGSGAFAPVLGFIAGLAVGHAWCAACRPGKRAVSR